MGLSFKEMQRENIPIMSLGYDANHYTSVRFVFRVTQKGEIGVFGPYTPNVY